MNNASESQVERFTLGERLLHGAVATAVLALLGSGLLIWQKADDWELWGVNLVSQGHVWLGGGLLVGSVAAYLVWGRRRQVRHHAGRFNAGQRLALRAVQVGLGFLVGSGSLLYLREFVAISKPVRTLIRQAHLLGAGAIVAFIVLHLVMVLVVPKNRGLLKGMTSGSVSRDTARRASPGWLPDVRVAVPYVGEPTWPRPPAGPGSP